MCYAFCHHPFGLWEQWSHPEVDIPHPWAVPSVPASGGGAVQPGRFSAKDRIIAYGAFKRKYGKFEKKRLHG